MNNNFRKDFNFKQSKQLINQSIYALNDYYSDNMRERYYNQYLGTDIKDKDFNKESKNRFNIFLDGIKLTATVKTNYMDSLIDLIKKYSLPLSFNISLDEYNNLRRFTGKISYQKVYNLYKQKGYFNNKFYINRNGYVYPDENKRYYKSPLGDEDLKANIDIPDNKIYELEQNMTINCNKLTPKNSIETKYILHVWFNPNKFLSFDKDMQTHEPLLRFLYDLVEPNTVHMSIQDLHINTDLNIPFNQIEIRKNKKTIRSNDMSSKYINNLKRGSKDKLVIYDKNKEINNKKSKSYFSEEEILLTKSNNNIQTTRIELKATNGEQVARYLRGDKHILNKDISILYKYKDENGRRHQRSLKESLNSVYAKIPKFLENSGFITEDIYLNTLNKHGEKKHKK